MNLYYETEDGNDARKEILTVNCYASRLKFYFVDDFRSHLSNNIDTICLTNLFSLKLENFKMFTDYVLSEDVKLRDFRFENPTTAFENFKMVLENTKDSILKKKSIIINRDLEKLKEAVGSENFSKSLSLRKSKTYVL